MDKTFNPFSLDGKTILVTGASSGIGKGIAIACSRMGATVIITGRNETKLQTTASALYGEKYVEIIADLTDLQSRETLVEQLPKLDGIVHCAGIGQRLPCKMLTEEDIDNVMSINFKSSVLLQAQLLSKKKVNRQASIVFMASRAAEIPSVGNSVYSASKGAVISYAKCLALEVASRLIRVNCICPAMVWTDLIYQGGFTKEDFEKAQLDYPLKRYGTPEDIANLAIYLLSDASSWMTGSSIDISGGGISS